MARPPSIPDPSSPSLPETLPLSPRLRVLAPSISDVTQDAGDLAAPVREQVLRGKQLLLQLKELSQHDAADELRPTLAALRLAIRSLEQDRHTLSQLDDIRSVLDIATHDLNELSKRQRRQAMWEERAATLADWMRDVVSDQDGSLDLVRDLARLLHREYQHHAPSPRWYEADPQDPAAWAAAHGLNTAQVLLRMTGATTGRQEALNAVLAGLVHDVGMALLPGGVLAVREAVTPAAKQAWREHPVWGAHRIGELLKPEEEAVDAAIAQHHERLDGSGYPHHLRGDQLTPLGRLLAAADSYAALCQARPHRPPHSPRTATQLLLKEVHAGRLDEAAVLTLLPWGMAPPGSVVELSDGSLAEVIAWGGSPPESGPRPVLAPYPSGGTPTVIDLEQARGRHIVRVLTPRELQEVTLAQAS